MHGRTFTPDRFSSEVKFPRSQFVPGTTRQRVRVAGGEVLDRQMVYMKAETWAILEKIAKAQKVSGSIVIERLLNLVAHAYEEPSADPSVASFTDSQ